MADKVIVISVGNTGAVTKRTMSLKKAEDMFFSACKMDHIVTCQLVFPDGVVHCYRKRGSVAVYGKKDFRGATSA